MELPQKLPNDNNGHASGDDRCRRCGKQRNPKKPDHCFGGHWMKDNTARGASMERHLSEQEQQKKILAARDHHLFDLGWTPDTAPLHVVTFCTLLAEVPIAAEHTRRSRSRTRELTDLLQKSHRLYSMFESFRRTPEKNDFKETTLDEDIAICRRLVAQAQEALGLAQHLKQMEAERETQSAVPVTTSDVAPPSLHTRPVSEPAFSRSPSSTSTGEIGLGRQNAATPNLSPASEFLAARDEPNDGEPDSSGENGDEDSDPTPDLWADGIRVTEAHVRRCLADVGDLAAYDSGRISTDAAYRRTQTWLRNLRRMR